MSSVTPEERVYLTTVTRSRWKRRSRDSVNQPIRESLTVWSFALHVLREPETAQAAMRFIIAGGIFLLVLAVLGALAFVLRPNEVQAIIEAFASAANHRSS